MLLQATVLWDLSPFYRYPIPRTELVFTLEDRENDKRYLPVPVHARIPLWTPPTRRAQESKNSLNAFTVVNACLPAHDAEMVMARDVSIRRLDFEQQE